MTKGQIQDRDGRLWLILPQAKTGGLVDVPAHRDLATIKLESDGKVTPNGIGVLMVWQKQGDALKLLARQGFKPEA
jgi:hypothetical protein